MKNHFICFPLGLAVGIFLSLWYQSSHDFNNPIVTHASADKLQKEVVKSEVDYSKAFDSLKMKSNKLGGELTETKAALTKAKQKTYSLQLQVYSLIDQQKENGADSNLSIDHTCDSLAGKVGELLQSSIEKDSLYEKTTFYLEAQLKNSDSTLLLKDKQYEAIKSAFTKSIDEQRMLIHQNKLLHKQAKKQQLKSKVFSAALFLITGAAVHYIIKQ